MPGGSHLSVGDVFIALPLLLAFMLLIGWCVFLFVGGIRAGLRDRPATIESGPASTFVDGRRCENLNCACLNPRQAVFCRRCGGALSTQSDSIDLRTAAAR